MRLEKQQTQVQFWKLVGWHTSRSTSVSKSNKNIKVEDNIKDKEATMSKANTLIIKPRESQEWAYVAKSHCQQRSIWRWNHQQFAQSQSQKKDLEFSSHTPNILVESRHEGTAKALG